MTALETLIHFGTTYSDVAISKTSDIAIKRGDTNSFDYIKNTCKIKVFDKKLKTLTQLWIPV